MSEPDADLLPCATGKTFDEIEQEFAGRGYGDFKTAVGEAVVELLRPIREETERLLADKSLSGERIPRRRGEGLPRGEPHTGQGL